MPTLAELAGIQAPANMDGTSVLPTLLGGRQNLADRFLYWEVPRRPLEQAVRFGDFKAKRKGIGAPLELYDIVRDFAEKQNIAARHPDIVARIENYLKSARTESPNWPAANP